MGTKTGYDPGWVPVTSDVASGTDSEDPLIKHRSFKELQLYLPKLASA